VYLHYYAIIIILDANNVLSQYFMDNLSSSKICYYDRPTCNSTFEPCIRHKGTA